MTRVEGGCPAPLPAQSSHLPLKHAAPTHPLRVLRVGVSVPLSVQLLALLFGSLALHACALDSGCGPVWGGGLRPSKPAATEAARRVPHKQREACLLVTLFVAYGMG